MIKVIAFDYAEVVAAGPMSKWTRENLDPQHEKYINYKEYAKRWDVGEMSLEQVYEILSDLTGTPPHHIWEKFYQSSMANEDVIEIIVALKKHYRIFLFSNFIGDLLRKLLEKHKITDLFDEIIISSDHKLAKPNPEFFQILLEKTGVEKNEIIFIDDKIKNVEGAENFGINAIQFIDAIKLKKDLEENGIKA